MLPYTSSKKARFAQLPAPSTAHRRKSHHFAPSSRPRTPSTCLLILFACGLTLLYLFSRSSADSSDPGHSTSFPPSKQKQHHQKHQPPRFVKSSVDWSALPNAHPIDGPLTPLPRGAPRQLPRVQHDFASDAAPSAESAKMQELRRNEVRAAFTKSWSSYRQYAWLHDELSPVSLGWKDTLGGWAATVVDSLDTLWIMGLEEEFREAVAAVAEIDWAAALNSAEQEDDSEDEGEDEGPSCNFFETTIRHLGGLLSAYDLSGEAVLLRKAVELGDMLYLAFDTPNRMPAFWLDLRRARAGKGQTAGTRDPSASVASSSLEFARLAQLTGDDRYYDAVDRVTQVLARTQNVTRLPGIWPTFLDMQFADLAGLDDGMPNSFTRDRAFTLGGSADSLYEYLPKTHALLGGLEPVYEQLYRGAMRQIENSLLFRPMMAPGTGTGGTSDADRDILFSGSLDFPHDDEPRLHAEGQHLACFAGGMFALGGRLFDDPGHVEIGERLARGCAWAYAAFPTGLMPEVFNMAMCPSLKPCGWDAKLAAAAAPDMPKGFMTIRDPRYMLRPEAIESVFVLWRVTGRPEWRETAWRMFQSVRRSTETAMAFSSVADVNVRGGAARTAKTDSMESFWTAETLKYFYLMFADPALVSLDDYVFNTEAHPFRRPQRGSE